MSILCCCIPHVDSCLVAGNIMLTSSVADSGRQFTCPGEIVLFTCQVFGSPYLQRNSPLVSPIIFTAIDTPPIFISRPPFLVSLTRNTGVGLNTSLTSILQVNTSRTFQQADTIIQCRNQQQDYVEANFLVSGV